MNINTDIIPQGKDHYKVILNGQILGTFERSQLRQFIGDIDNAID